MTPDRSNRYSRRALLKALGLGVGLLPLLDSEKVIASAAGVAKRFISITWTNGIVPQNFYPAPGPLTAPLPAILSPLEPWKSKVLAMRGPGVDVFTGGVDIQVMVDIGLLNYGHSSYPSLLTGSVGGTSASIDTLISDALKLNGFQKPQLHVGVLPGITSTSYGAGGQKNPTVTDPYQLYDLLFGSGTVDLSRRKSVLDYCIDDLTRFGSRIGREDKLKIDAHLQAIRAIEQQLPSPPSCAPPAPSPAGVNFRSATNFPAHTKLVLDMVAAAVKCDIARAIAVDLIDDAGGSSLAFPWLDIPSPDYLAIAHQGGLGYAQKTQIDTWFYSQVAGLVAQLAENPEGDSTSLDNSAILVCNDCNEGASEEVVSLPYLIIGSAGGFFKQGTCVQFPQNVPNNRLLNSVCHALDLRAAGIGSAYPGDLDALLGA